MQFINQYSFLIMGLVLALVFIGWRMRAGMRKQDWLALGALAIGFVVAFGFFRPAGTQSAAHLFEDNLGESRPILLEFQSPYCLACMAAKPYVDRIEADYPSLLIVRINVQDASARDLLNTYDFQYTPTFIFFDEEGTEVWRSAGAIDPEWVAEAMEPQP